MEKEIEIKLTLDIGALNRQICEVLMSNLPEDEKQGIHNLLGYLLDKAEGRI